DDEARVALAFELALGRPPSDTERVGALQLIHQTAQRKAEDRAGAGDPADENAAARTPPPDPRQAGWAALCRALVVTAEFRYLADIE
ncbi:MAG: hypothetical protein CMJ48_01580, partial [Planctomycetaceae bacterium]|nr:hypothetical protein [Planctomycetaceae bacterium]